MIRTPICCTLSKVVSVRLLISFSSFNSVPSTSSTNILYFILPRFFIHVHKYSESLSEKRTEEVVYRKASRFLGNGTQNLPSCLFSKKATPYFFIQRRTATPINYLSNYRFGYTLFALDKSDVHIVQEEVSYHLKSKQAET